MNEHAELVAKLIDLTVKDKLKWFPSPVKGGYTAKIGLLKVEILKPISMSTAVMQRTIEVVVDPISVDNERLRPNEEWRLISYDSMGEIAVQIFQSDFYPYDSIRFNGQTVDKPLQFLHKEIERQFRRQDVKEITKLLNELDKI